MEKYKIVEITTRKEILEGVSCDICKENIPNKTYYYDVTTGHYDWGHDSIDSIKESQVCEKCISTAMEDYIKCTDKSKYLNIEREYLNL